MPDLSLITELHWLPKGAHCLQFLSSTQILAGGGDGSVKVFSVQAHAREHLSARPKAGLAEIIHHDGTAGAIGVLSPDHAHYLSVFTNGTFSIWNTATLAESGPFPLPVKNLSCAAIAPGGDLVAFAQQDGQALLWRCSSGEIRTFARPSTDGFPSMVFSRDGRMLAFTHWRKAEVWDVASARRIHVLSYPYPTYLFCVEFTPDGGRLVGSTAIGDQMIWRLDQPEPILRLRGLVMAGTGFAVTADGKTLVAARNEVRFWDLATGVQTHQIPPTYGDALCVALSPDERRLAVGMLNGTIAIFDTVTFREVAVFRAFDTWILRMAFTPDGNTLFAATVEELRIWKAAAVEDEIEAGTK